MRVRLDRTQRTMPRARMAATSSRRSATVIVSGSRVRFTTCSGRGLRPVRRHNLTRHGFPMPGAVGVRITSPRLRLDTRAKSALAPSKSAQRRSRELRSFRSRRKLRILGRSLACCKRLAYRRLLVHLIEKVFHDVDSMAHIVGGRPIELVCGIVTKKPNLVQVSRLRPGNEVPLHQPVNLAFEIGVANGLAALPAYPLLSGLVQDRAVLDLLVETHALDQQPNARTCQRKGASVERCYRLPIHLTKRRIPRNVMPVMRLSRMSTPRRVQRFCAIVFGGPGSDPVCAFPAAVAPQAFVRRAPGDVLVAPARFPRGQHCMRSGSIALRAEHVLLLPKFITQLVHTRMLREPSSHLPRNGLARLAITTEGVATAKQRQPPHNPGGRLSQRRRDFGPKQADLRSRAARTGYDPARPGEGNRSGGLR